jgi:transcriptional regulator with XRE-family HTH domain
MTIRDAAAYQGGINGK